MKIIDAFWEKRNLSIDTIEIVLDRSDTVQEVEESLKEILKRKDLYCVVKVPDNKFSYLQLLAKYHFCFIESQFELSLELKNYSIPAEFEKFDKGLEYRLVVDDKDIFRIEDEIKKGIFDTDRIAIDPCFGLKTSANRYVNWINDELSKRSKIFEIYFKQSPISFFVLKPLGNNKYDSLLAGMYKDCPNLGLGFSIVSKPINELQIIKADRLVTHVSSNNLPVLRLYIKFGFIISDVCSVMIKHI